MPAQQHIGNDLRNAIDWMQDRWGTTRPLAESMLFRHLEQRRIVETEEGFLLLSLDTSDDPAHHSKQIMMKRRGAARRMRHQVRMHSQMPAPQLHEVQIQRGSNLPEYDDLFSLEEDD